MRDEVLLNTELPKQQFSIPIEISMCHIDWIISEYPHACSKLEISSHWDDFIRNWFEDSYTSQESDAFEQCEIPERVIVKQSTVSVGTGFPRAEKSAGTGKCQCKGDCSNNRCSCKKSKLICNSKCHSGRICKNK